MEEKDKKVVKPKPQNILLENREKLLINGVLDVESFNEQFVIVHTDLGVLAVRGEGLHISRLNLDNGELNVEGDIVSLEYTESEGSKGGFFSRLFK
jgi:sporulation protein YabP